MGGFFSHIPNEPRFQLFDVSHIIPLILLGFLLFLLYRNRVKIREWKYEKYLRYSMATILVLSDMSIYVWRILTDTFTIESSLPLHLCTVSAYLLVYVLFTKNRAVFRYVFYAGLAGTIMALVNPSFGGFNYTQYRYYEYMIIHIVIFLGFIYMVDVHEFIPTVQDMKKSFFAVHVYAALIIPFNYATGATYMMLVNGNIPILDILGPWPMSAIMLEIFLLLLFLLTHLYVKYLVLRPIK